MSARGILAPLIAVVTWPASRLADLGRTYDLSIGPADTLPLIRGGVAVDPLFRNFGDGNAQSATQEVGRVWDPRFEIYISGRYASGLGLIGRVEETPTGSRVITEVGWTGPFKWVIPGLTVMVIAGGIALARDLPAIISRGSDEWPTAAMVAMAVGGLTLNGMTRERRARHDDLPMIIGQLDRVLAPYRR